ncbi:MAG: hypothetical protein NC916_02430, partial [Candidatus Omnitrophica bacterium]|nr:hypothetical protein [Candidatus Omnitrophota bacterium]
RGKGLNPYEPGSPYYQFQQATMANFMQNVMPQLTAQAASSGMLRGSASERATARAGEGLGNLLQTQAYNEYLQRLNQQYETAKYLSELPSRYMGLMGQVASAYAGGYQPIQYAPSGLAQLLSGILPAIGQGLGIGWGLGIR